MNALWEITCLGNLEKSVSKRVLCIGTILVSTVMMLPSLVSAQSSANPSRIDERIRPRPENPALEAPLKVPTLPETRPEAGKDLQKFKNRLTNGLKPLEFAILMS